MSYICQIGSSDLSLSSGLPVSLLEKIVTASKTFPEKLRYAVGDLKETGGMGE
jgi:hypothetical protein